MNDLQSQEPNNSGPVSPQANYFNFRDHSKTFKTLIIILAELILLVGAFSLGVNVALHKARYTYFWAKNYSNNFPVPTGRQFTVAPPPGNSQVLIAHGVDGNIISLSSNNLTIKDDSGTEKTVILSTGTTIRHDYQNLQATDLKAGQEIVVLGDPNDSGQIQAKFIRVLDEQN